MNRICIYSLFATLLIAYKCNALQASDTATTVASCIEQCSCGTRFTPIGVSTDHIHNKGEWMLAYDFMDMQMDGMHIGSKSASSEEVYKNYMMSTNKMTMQMHMLMLMYGITDRLTLMGMTGFVYNYMSMGMAQNMPSMPGMNMNGMPNGMESSTIGWGDSKLTALYSIYAKSGLQVAASLGASLPTGSINQTGTTMLGEGQRLPYGMQTGTGSYSALPGITVTEKFGKLATGLSTNGDIKLNYNYNGYKCGNLYQATVWAAYPILNFVSGSLRAEGTSLGTVSGADPQINIPINVAYDPTADTKNTGGKWLNLYAGLNFHFQQPIITKFQVLTEFGIPAYQNLNGTQAAQSYNLQVGVWYGL